MIALVVSVVALVAVVALQVGVVAERRRAARELQADVDVLRALLARRGR